MASTLTNEDREALKRNAEDRQIRCLYHYTRISNLPTILENGLCSLTDLKHLNISYMANDMDRLDNQPRSISVSIGFPNYLTFYTKRRESGADFAILALRPDLLWELDAAFNRSNAASSEMAATPIGERKTLRAFGSMFGDLTGIERSKLKLRPYYTTDPQAELLVFERIDPSYIMFVNVENEEVKAEVEKMLAGKPYFRTVSVYPDLYRPRSDWRFWAERRSKGD